MCEGPPVSSVKRNSINFNKSCYTEACPSYYAIWIPRYRPVTHTWKHWPLHPPFIIQSKSHTAPQGPFESPETDRNEHAKSQSTAFQAACPNGSSRDVMSVSPMKVEFIKSKCTKVVFYCAVTWWECRPLCLSFIKRKKTVKLKQNKRAQMLLSSFTVTKRILMMGTAACYSSWRKTYTPPGVYYLAKIPTDPHILLLHKEFKALTHSTIVLRPLM